MALQIIKDVFPNLERQQASVNAANASEIAAQRRSDMDDATQSRLSDLLKAARPSDGPHRSLVERILRIIKSPSPQLGLELAKSLRLLGQCLAAEDLLCRQIADLPKSSGVFLPHYQRELALTVQTFRSRGAVAVQHFDSAIDGLTIQLGPHHTTTLTCRYESAVQLAQIGDSGRAISVLGDILAAIEGKQVCSKGETRLLRACSSKLNLLQGSHQASTAGCINLSASSESKKKRKYCEADIEGG